MSQTRGGTLLRHSIRSVPFRLGVLLVAVVGLLVPSTTASAGAGCTFRLVNHPEVGHPPFDQLYGIDARSATDVWVVGSSGAAAKPLVLHRDGPVWSIVPSVAKGSTAELYDITEINLGNAWAVGYYLPPGGSHTRTLIEHWNGTRWSVVPSPNPISGADNFLKGVDAVSANDIWAVGSNGRPGSKTIIEHYNGSKWVTVPGAFLQFGGDLKDVSAISRTNVVAVGARGTSSSDDALVERFDGQDWIREGVPAGATSGADLKGVSTPSASAQWAAGSRSGTAALQTLALRNTGSGWDLMDSPSVGTDKINFFSDISALSATNAWAVGERETSNFVRRTLIAHFTNGAWKVIASPNSGTGHNELFGVAPPHPATGLWTVGTAAHPIGSTGLIEYSC